MAWTVVKTRWPVSAELMAICAGLLITDFADQDLVRIVPKDGTQSAGEGEALLFIDRDLRDAADLVLDRVFDGDDLVFVALDLVERGIECCRFAGTGGGR